MVITINGTQYDPSELTIGLQDVSAPEAGRDLSGLMHKMTVAQKVTIQVAWWQPTPALVSQVLNSVQFDTTQQHNPIEYFPVTYNDPLTNTTVTKTFYVGDRSAPVQVWGTGTKRYSKLSFKLIEQ